MDNATALNFKRSDFGDKKEYGLLYPCALFDTDGNKLTKLISSPKIDTH